MMQVMNNSRRAPTGGITFTAQPRRLQSVLMDESQSVGGRCPLPMPLCDQRPAGESDSQHTSAHDESPGNSRQLRIFLPPTQLPGEPCVNLVTSPDLAQPRTTSAGELALQTVFGVAPGMPGRPAGFEGAATASASVLEMLDVISDGQGREGKGSSYQEK